MEPNAGEEIVTRMRDARPAREKTLRKSSGEREGERHARASSQSILGPDAAALRLDEPAGDRQPEPGAAACSCSRRVGAPEAVEHALLPSGLHAAAGALDAH